MRQYGPDLIQATWRVVGFVPVDLTPGLASGPFIQPTRDVPSWSKRPNGVGGIVRLFNADRSGAVVFLIDTESRTHLELLTIANADLVTRSLTGPIVVRDGNTKRLTIFSKAYVTTQPDEARGVTGGVVGWRFEYESYLDQPFGFNENVVGA